MTTRPTKPANTPATGTDSRTMRSASAEALREKPGRAAGGTTRAEQQAPVSSLYRYAGLATEYSQRARAARGQQDLPAVVEDATVLTQVSSWMAEDLQRAHEATTAA